MHVHALSFHGNPNVGLLGYCARAGEAEICILGERLGKENESAIEQALQARIEHVMVAGTPMPGVFLAGNSRALLVPAIAFPHEVAKLRALGLPVQLFETKNTCLGNNIVANDHGCLVNPEFSDEEIARLSSLLGVPVKRIEIAGLPTPGACLVLNGKRAVIHRDAAEDEMAMVKATLGLAHVEPASVNLGSPYVHAGIIANRHGFIISDQSGGPEIVHIDQSLGYMGDQDGD